MVCRESKLSSALITFARGATGLEDRQAVALNHALMQESSGTQTPTQTEWNHFIDTTIDAYESGRIRIRAGSQNPVPRLREARNEVPSASRYYAAQRLIERAVASERGHREYLENYARLCGVSYDDARLEFGFYEMEMTSDSANQPSATFVRAWEADTSRNNLLVDRRALYVYEQMENNLRARIGSPVATPMEYRPAVTRRAVGHGSWIAEIGYDPINGRLEMVPSRDSDRVYAYRMSPEEYEDIFGGSNNIGSNFSRLVRNNPAFQYETEEESELAAFHHRCATCGQFAGISYHYCPATGSVERANQDIRNDMNRVLANAGQATLPGPVGNLLTSRSVTRVTAPYQGTPVNLRIPSPAQMMAGARASDTSTVRANVIATIGDETLEGQVAILYEGRGRGYMVSPITFRGDSGTDNLRCSCRDYRTRGTCLHLNAVTDNMMTLIQGQNRFTAAQIASGTVRATTNIGASYDASMTAKERAEARWTPVSKSYEENPELFQKFYDEAKAAKDAFVASKASGDPIAYPVPYIKENAFGGIGQRGGRGFGTELEFDFPDSMSQTQRTNARRGIGAALYAAGLTSSQGQTYHGSQRSGYATEHARGWAFENDISVNGGEIISPIMYDEPETWENLEKVCNIIKEHGGIATTSAGSHVHVGAGDYNHTVSNHNHLLQAYAENEDLLFRLSSSPETGTHRGKSYCTPNRVSSSPYSSLTRVRSDHANSHFTAINFENVKGESKDHIEFRTFDATLNPAVIQAQIGMSLYLTEGALRDSSTPASLTQKSLPIGTMRRNNSSRTRLTGEAWNESTKAVRSFIDHFVPGASDGNEEGNIRARQIVSLFAMTKWQS